MSASPRKCLSMDQCDTSSICLTVRGGLPAGSYFSLPTAGISLPKGSLWGKAGGGVCDCWKSGGLLPNYFKDILKNTSILAVQLILVDFLHSHFRMC